MMWYRFTTSKLQNFYPTIILRMKDFTQVKQLQAIKLKHEEIEQVLQVQQLNSTWKANDQSLTRTFKFKNFKEAFSFMNQVAILAEQLDHHPDWENVYNTVKIKLNTHDVGGVSIKDVVLAHAIDIVGLNITFKSAESVQDTRSLELGKIVESWNTNFTNYQKILEASGNKI